MPGIRIDTGVVEGSEVSVHYDPLLAKLIASGESRDAATRRAIAALEAFPVLGVATNTAYVLEILRHPRFVAGELDTHFLEVEHDRLIASLSSEPPPVVADLAALAASPGSVPAAMSRPDPWDRLRLE